MFIPGYLSRKPFFVLVVFAILFILHVKTSKEQENVRAKTIGQVFTPSFIVDAILNYCNYSGCSIIGKHIIDNSCGDGAFLRIIVQRYIDACLEYGLSNNDIVFHLQTYIHGIDNDKIAYDSCLDNLNSVALDNGLEGVEWDIYHENALTCKRFDNQMDYVVGNPPYVRVHNLEDSYNEVKTYLFANGGMTDLYLAFFELGFNMLSPKGELCYITPSSWLSSVAANNMRNYIMQHQNLLELIDLEHFQAFENATAYTMISHFQKGKNDGQFNYYTYDSDTRCRFFVERLKLEDVYIDSNFYLSNSQNLHLLREIKTKKFTKYVSVKNGFATLADKVFIGSDIPDSPITIPVLKGSTGKWYKGLFPYDKNGKPLPLSVIFSNSAVKFHYQSCKEQLLKGRPEFEGWYLYGRTQALSDVWRKKLAVNTLVRTEKDFKLIDVNAGEGIYSGLYITTEHDISLHWLKTIIATPNCVEYIKLLKKYKSGGYYTFNSKDLEQYLNYYISLRTPQHYADQSDISQHHPDLFHGVY